MTMLQLPEVMLCAASSVALEKTWEALERSSREIRFGDAVFFTDNIDKTPFGSSDIRCELIRPLRSREAYSNFILKGLASRNTCEHVLIIQWDGFVCDPRAWRNEFLSYDYIGATWPHFPPPFNVGNGGFSLRSKRLLDALASERFASQHPEDVAICHDWRPALEADFGIRFAPPEVAEQFSFERGEKVGPTFGFHGLFNIPDAIPRADQEQWLADLRSIDLVSRDAEDLIIRLAEDGRRLEAFFLWRRKAKNPRISKQLTSWFRLLCAFLGKKSDA